MSRTKPTALATWQWAIVAIVAALAAAFGGAYLRELSPQAHELFFPSGRLSARKVAVLWIICGIPVYLAFVAGRWQLGRRRSDADAAVAPSPPAEQGPSLSLAAGATGVVAVLVAAACTIAYLGIKETSDLFMQDAAIQATVVTTKIGRKRARVIVRFREGNQEVERATEGASAEDARAVKPGDRVNVLRHHNVPSRVALQVTALAERPSPLLLVGVVAGLALAIVCFWGHRIRRRR